MTDEKQASSLSALASEIDYDDIDDEAEFNPSDENSDDDNEEEDESQEDNYAILTGSLCFNDEGRLVYSGTWGMKDAEKSTIAESKEKKKKKKKFKLKSKQIVKSDEKKIFQLAEPLSGKHKKHKHRTMLFDGFFFDPQEGESHSKKVKERDVEISFHEPLGDCSESNEKKTTDEPKDSGNKSFLVKGKGHNEYGAFTLDGTYSVEEPKESTGESDSVTVIITCKKRYSVSKSSNGHKSDEYYSEEEEDEYNADEAADFDEIIALNEEANMSVEELRKRYLSAENSAVDQAVAPPHKKLKADDMSDDEYGF